MKPFACISITIQRRAVPHGAVLRRAAPMERRQEAALLRRTARSVNAALLIQPTFTER